MTFLGLTGVAGTYKDPLTLHRLFSCVGTAFWVYIVPSVATWVIIAELGCPAGFQLAFILPSAIALIGGPMSVCLHRYFAHTAFKTSRGMQLVLGVIACLANQKGPIWWASKHRRHHKHCDLPNDPHSWTQSNFFYAWIGWTLSLAEALVDDEYVTKLQSFAELRALECLWMIPSLALNAVLLFSLGPHWMISLYTVPMVLCNLITLLFNVEYHPAHKPGEDDCKSVDNARFLSELVGESYHEDHHAHPRKGHRPGYDVPSTLILHPLVAMGLIWDVRTA